MEKDLNRLSEKEYSILNKIRGLSGSIESKIIQINGLNLPEIYNEIYKTYTNFDSIEALKRAIFIQWYSVSEPIAYTGIGTLDKTLEEKNISKVIGLITNEEIDQEFKIMLDYYVSVSDWYFSRFDKYEQILQSLSKIAKSAQKSKQMINRGQMGEYWNSLNK
jgi:hypothetical protein